MSISHKGKHNFWSRLLLGIVALFVSSQELNYRDNLPNSNYQSAQQQAQPQTHFASVLVQQNQQTQKQISAQPVAEKKLFEKPPHFCAQHFALHAPIRAGPQLA